MFKRCDCLCHVKPVLHFKECCPETNSQAQNYTRCAVCHQYIKIEETTQHIGCVAPKPIEFKTMTLPAIRKQNE